MFFGQRKKKKRKKKIKHGRTPDETRRKLSKAMRTHWANENYRSMMIEYANTRTPEQVQKHLEEMQYELKHTPENFFGV